jgi:putative FmdB family regulatory protein
MPIYEFYCPDCNTIFNFFSGKINTRKKPLCPRCKKVRLTRRMSAFATTGRAAAEDTLADLPFDERKMEKAMGMLASQAETLDENDPRQAADLVRKLTDMTGMELGPGMQEALSRMESGEDPDKIEAEMGDLLEGEDPFAPAAKKGRKKGAVKPAPDRDETLYDL